MPSGTCIPIGGSAFYKDLLFFRSCNNPSGSGLLLKDYISYPANPRKTHYLYSFSVKFEIYEDRNFEKCLNSFVIWDTYPVRYKALDIPVSSFIGCNSPGDIDKFRYETRSRDPLLPFANICMAKVVDLVVKVTPNKNSRDNKERSYTVCISSPQVRELFEGDFYYDSLTYDSSNDLLKILCSKKLQIDSHDGLLYLSDDIILASKELSSLKKHHNHMTKIGLDIMYEFERVLLEKREDIQGNVGRGPPRGYERSARRCRLAHVLHAAVVNFLMGCTQEISACPPGNVALDRILRPENIRFTTINNNCFENAVHGKTHLITFINPFNIDWDTTEDFGTGLIQCGRYVTFENFSPAAMAISCE